VNNNNNNNNSNRKNIRRRNKKRAVEQAEVEEITSSNQWQITRQNKIVNIVISDVKGN